MKHLCKVNIVDIEQIFQVSEPNNEAQHIRVVSNEAPF